MEKRLFLFIILSALLFMTACGNDQENDMGGNSSSPPETQEPAGSGDDSNDDNKEKNDDSGGSDDKDGSDDSGDEGENGKDDDGNENGENGESEHSLRVMQHDSLGEHLADSKGMTLYYFTDDEPGTSNCTDDCLDNWPAFTASDLTVPEGYEDDDFSTITREDDGEKQVTYKGYPLYYFVNDMAEGDANGQGLSGAWYIVNDTTEFPD